MRFTVHVFLEICSARPAFAAICQKLGSLVFREPPSQQETDCFDWGVPDIDDAEDDSHDDPERQVPSGDSPNVIADHDFGVEVSNGAGVGFGLSEAHSKRSTFGNGHSSSDSSTNNRTLKRRSAASTSTSLSSLSDSTEASNHTQKVPSIGSEALLHNSSHSTSTGASFLEVDNDAIAQQLTVLESEIFSRIKVTQGILIEWAVRSIARA